MLGLYRRADLPHGLRDVTVALWHVGDPGNVGTPRAADAFDAGVALGRCADATGPKAPGRRRARCSACRSRASTRRRRRGSRLWRGRASRSRRLNFPRVTFVLGAEREGLPDDVAAACELRATIPQPGEAESLNVAVAGAIALYELARRLVRGLSDRPASSQSAATDAAYCRSTGPDRQGGAMEPQGRVERRPSRATPLRRAGVLGAAAAVPTGALVAEAATPPQRERLESLTAAEADALDAMLEIVDPDRRRALGARRPACCASRTGRSTAS